MRNIFSPLYLIFLITFTLWIIFSINVHLMTLTFERLGLSPGSALLLMVSSLLGSVINVPLFTLRASAPSRPIEDIYRGLLRPSRLPFTGYTRVAVNVGGCLVPLMFSFCRRRREIGAKRPMEKRIAARS